MIDFSVRFSQMVGVVREQNPRLSEDAPWHEVQVGMVKFPGRPHLSVLCDQCNPPVSAMNYSIADPVLTDIRMQIVHLEFVPACINFTKTLTTRCNMLAGACNGCGHVYYVWIDYNACSDGGGYPEASEVWEIVLSRTSFLQMAMRMWAEERARRLARRKFHQ